MYCGNFPFAQPFLHFLLELENVLGKGTKATINSKQAGGLLVVCQFKTFSSLMLRLGHSQKILRPTGVFSRCRQASGENVSASDCTLGASIAWVHYGLEIVNLQLKWRSWLALCGFLPEVFIVQNSSQSRIPINKTKTKRNSSLPL